MGEMITLTAADGHEFAAYKVASNEAPKGCVVIVQEIFGVNSHIKDVCDGYAKAGFNAIAPALYDRISPDIELDYTPKDVEQGLQYKNQVSDETALKDIDAAANEIDASGNAAVIGYCWGGTLAYLSACRLSSIGKAVGYYGGQVAQNIAETPKAPVMLHFGDKDASIPMSAVEEVKAARPDIPVFVYSAGHGFNCDQRGSYDAEAAKLALERTLEFIS
ncbi:MAG: carboxymethylenebutenolidase [Sneathiella sp.]|uniref:dienelactone hydrolase family protein n=1 Tax=Sneathiella sp. TaxID=1964365 RepID=UPI000C3B49C9|nr:dienelactone hydrolase family protein [Sneathiella sp.]MAZ01852.1 carboxymethylenebutenolidase [Sneathiella sp.]